MFYAPATYFTLSFCLDEAWLSTIFSVIWPSEDTGAFGQSCFGGPQRILFLEIVSGLFPKLPNGFCNAGHVHVAEYLKVPLHIFFTMPWTYVL